jgi:hypothetical protein
LLIYKLNSLVIFTVTVGSNTLGVATTKGGASGSAGISAAYAQVSDGGLGQSEGLVLFKREGESIVMAGV